jgi:effector-binding domain-containing protein
MKRYKLILGVTGLLTATVLAATPPATTQSSTQANGDSAMNLTIRVEKFAGQRLAVVKRKSAAKDLSKVIPEACGLVWNELKNANVKDAGRLVAVYKAMNGDVFDLEVGAEIGSAFAGAGEVFESNLPAGNVVTATYFGPYDKLGEVHHAIMDWCKAENREMGPACWETYGHWQPEWKDDPSKIRTDVYYLLKE